MSLLKSGSTAGGSLIITADNISSYVFPSGTAGLFAQASAPTGWTKSTTHNDKALRVVNGGTGGTSGGSTGFSSVFASRTPAGSVSVSLSDGSVGAHTLTSTEMPSHTHNVPSHGNSDNAGCSASGGGFMDNCEYPTKSTGGDGSHSHSYTSPSVSSSSFSGSAMDFAVAYVDIIIATKN